VIYETSPSLMGDRDAQFALAARAPMLAAEWDVRFDDTAACAAMPSDPAIASALVQANLDYFDAHAINWTVSEFVPGRLIKDLSYHDATSLENGWTCGKQAYPAPGLGRLIQAHLRAAEERALFVVSAAGGVDVPRGGYAIAYGPVMADADSRAANGPRLPFTLGKLAVEVTDSRGVTRPAGIYWATAGWGQVNFVIPPDSAPGPGRMTVVREDGSRSGANVTIVDTAPGFWTGISCRGPAMGSAVQVLAGGRTSRAPISTCDGVTCKTLPVAVSRTTSTRVRVVGSGFRNAKSLEVTVGGVKVPVVSFGPGADAGMDQVTIEIPASLQGLGEADLICRANGRTSNPVRIRIGGARPVS
jgi:uncharacterized protein (TIGR03437 family)